jgi:hypothetical protein
MLNKTALLIFGILTILLILVCLPRFNRSDKGFSKYSANIPGDSKHYVNYIDYFKGRVGKSELEEPYIYRPLVPYLASLLPFDAMTSLNVLNLLFMIATLFFLVLTLNALFIRHSYLILSGILFVFSFPTFYYSTIGYLDPVVLLIIMSSIYAMTIKAYIILPAIILAGGFSKETTLIIIPVYFVYMLVNKERRTVGLVYFAVSVVMYLSAVYISRHVVSPIQTNFQWMPSLERFFYNIARVRTWGSFMLTFGIPGLLSLLILVRLLYKKSYNLLVNLLPYFCGIAVSVLLFVYSLFSAYSDGRFIWPAVLFSILILAIYLNEKRAVANQFTSAGSAF